MDPTSRPVAPLTATDDKDAKKPAGHTYVLMVEHSAQFGLRQLPLVGDEIPETEDVKFSGLRFIASSKDLPPEKAEAVNQLLESLGPDRPSPLLPGKVGKGVTLETTCTVSPQLAHTFRLRLGDSGRSKDQADIPSPPMRAQIRRSAPTAPDPIPAAPAAAWLNVNKTLGPLTVRRIGVGYHDQELSVLTDATMKAGPLAIGVDGLGLGVRLDKLFKGDLDIDGRLSGLSIDYSTPSLEIAGAFLKGIPPEGYDLDISGLLMVKASKYSFGAVGAYLHKPGGRPSLFLFGEVGAEIGGPPPFIVTGLMGGFGYNSSLRIPTLEEVSGFPLLTGLSSKPSSGPTPAATSAKDQKKELLTTLGSLTTGTNAWVTPADGEIWIAAGLTFKLFELINARALLTAEFGSGFTISLLGLADASFPPEESGVTTPKYANIELELEAVYSTKKAMLAVDALLTPRSFLLDPACHLTGGFALHCWFDGSEHPGDFVLSLGGYHPQFKPPSHYPNPPRLGINWDVSDTVSIKGGSYLALTPSAFMVGSSLDIRYHSGNVRAWLTAHIDALIQWKPFHFDFTAGISLGASLNTHIFGTWTVEVGADMHLWGPPTGGKVTVHVLGIGITISFGEPATAPDPKLDWEEFTTLLPKREQILQILPVNGLMPPPPTPAGSSAPAPGFWVFSSHGFTLETRTAVPASELVIGGKPLAEELQDPKPARVNIRPMHDAGQGLISRHCIALVKHGDNGERTPFDPRGHEWTVSAQRALVPSALWGQYTDDTAYVLSADKQLVAGQITGVRITAPGPVPGTSLCVKAAKLASTALTHGINPLGTADDRSAVLSSERKDGVVKLISSKVMDADIVRSRTDLFERLRAWGMPLGPDSNGDLTPFADQAGRLFADEPLVATS
ncbi:DUF6603 domain-containing protein [Streptomyces olivoreticuli]|uniref:DUF6603 domain-containing protein n=1 Tax=Streptomyces olivoreticuli TaxID=68246 RepID=UPI0013C2D43D|nr:DUF6603 domain-containing protein [Streptomyces olivoreticuli]